jgi:hypothetical protein
VANRLVGDILEQILEDIGNFRLELLTTPVRE